VASRGGQGADEERQGERDKKMNTQRMSIGTRTSAEDQFSGESPFFFHSSLPHKQVNNYVFLFSFMMKF
jgi:hypothetical protein